MSNPLTDMPEGEPKRVVAGDTWTWKRSDLASDFPPASYNLSYALRREGDATTVKTVTASESGDEYRVTVAAATTAGYDAGKWHWQAFATRVSDDARVRVGYGVMVVEANGAVASDPRSHAARMLAGIETLLEGRVLKDVNSYTIAGRSISKMTVAELTKWRDEYRREVNNERRLELARQGKATGRTTVVRFRT